MKMRYNAAAYCTSLVTLLLEEACPSRSSILLRTLLVYIGIGKFRSTKQIAYTVNGTLSEVCLATYRYFIQTVCLTSEVVEKSASFRDDGWKTEKFLDGIGKYVKL